MKDPFKPIGVIFSAVAAVELAVLLALATALRTPSRKPSPMPPNTTVCTPSTSATTSSASLLRRRRLLREQLVAGGHREMAEVAGLEWQTNVRINGRCPCRLICRIERNGVLHEYRSQALRFDPGLLPGSRVPVYLDPYDDKRYYVDVESAAPAVVRH